MLEFDAIATMVSTSLAEDIGDGDISAALLSPDVQATAMVISRESAIVCGKAWVDEVFRQLDPAVNLIWHVADGEQVKANQTWLTLKGPARAIVSGERTALNWLQTLSATATLTARYVAELAKSNRNVELLDTRKTLPGLRYAQKYAVACGGGKNHRLGLFDAYLIKENHIMTCGSIAVAIAVARQQQPLKIIEIEVETIAQLQQALVAQADIILLDNFSLDTMKQAVTINQGRAKLEVSGNVDFSNINQIAATGIDRISVGALTKNIQAIDLSLRVQL